MGPRFEKKRAVFVLVRGGFRTGILVGLFLGPLATDGRAQQPKPDLSSLSLESLSSIEITSISRKEQKLTEEAGAIFVISSEDIRQSGLSASTWIAISRASDNFSRSEADIRTNEDAVQDPNGTITATDAAYSTVDFGNPIL